ncbi:hypothetical protein [Streptomyces sp. NBC_01363]|uniref:hypothetical protein n=1 Tax=Streptomyces sp. NBC_01363 TaxID=2903840 RepID=UPI00225B9C89|nr:hypothetical protein [Streptomyces sp. NBC_01363]MCX4731115.1 hypothetical protein [Streptomyces sp. NBC_01363]
MTEWQPATQSGEPRRSPPPITNAITNAIGGHWNRANDPGIDLVGADHSLIAKKIPLAGPVNQPENKPFDNRNLARLPIHRSQPPGAHDAISSALMPHPCPSER